MLTESDEVNPITQYPELFKSTTSMPALKFGAENQTDFSE